MLKLSDWLMEKCCSCLQLAFTASCRDAEEVAENIPPLSKYTFFDKDNSPYVIRDKADAQFKADGLMIVNRLPNRGMQ